MRRWQWVLLLGVWVLGVGEVGTDAAERVAYANSTTYADSVVTFNEVLYQPVGGNPADEWIELHNQHAVLEDLSGWVIEGGITFRFPEGTTIPGGGYLLIAADPARFRANTGMTAWGPFLGRLSDGGDRLVLRNRNLRRMDELDYGDSEPWPVAADGSGATLAKRVEESPSSPPENWRSSLEVGGTPGAENFPVVGAAPPVVQDAFIGLRSPGRWRVPGESDALEAWQDLGFDDSGWLKGTNGYGFGPTGVVVVPGAARFYPFEKTSSDTSGNAVHATLQSGTRFVSEPSPASGSTTSIQFDGVDDQVRIVDGGEWPAYTLAMWVRFETVQAGSLVVRTDDAGPMVSWSHQLRITEGRRFEHYTYDGDGNAVTGTTVVEAGRWYHVAVTAESGGVARLYVNGVAEGVAEPVETLWPAGNRWLLGTASHGFPSAFRGWMDDFGIWDRVLDAGAIQALVQGSAPSPGGGVLGALVGTDLGPAARGVRSSVWVRHPFDAPGPVGYDQMVLRVRYDDGFIAWLNGVEIARRNAPAVATWSSAATVVRADDEVAVEETVDLTGRVGLLRLSGNVLAVQMLNVTANDDDLFFLAELNARRRSPRPTGSASLLFSEVAPAESSEFFCEVVNPGPETVALDGWVIRSSAGGEYRWGGGVLEPGGWRVLGTNMLGFAVGPSDRLFLVDTVGRRVADGVALSRGGRARRTWAVAEPFLRPMRPTPGASNEVVLRDEIVINEILYHPPPAYASPAVPAESSLRTVLRWDAEWRHLATGVAPGPGWRANGFDDADWGRGAGLLGNRTGVIPEPLKTTLKLGQITYYFRVPFVVESIQGICGIQVRAIVDDGAVLYLNGEEIWRIRMPDGEVGPETLGLNSGDPPVDGPISFPVAALKVGTNWLAMEVHQWNRDSSDVVGGAELALCTAQAEGVPAKAYEESDEQWIELYNRSGTRVDLSGWRLSEDIDFVFPVETRISPGEYLVVARDAAEVARRHPGIRVVGDWSRRLGGRGGRIRLLDAVGNPADDVGYFDDEPWPARADGGGSSLELRDPNADNASVGAWASSDESGRSEWQTYTYRARAVTPVKAPAQNGFHEFRMGLLADGEVLVDDLSVVEEPDGAARSLIQNGTFDDARAWRFLGNHSHSQVVDDPDRSGNKVLRLVATDARGYMHNQLETTLKSGGVVVPVVAGRTYAISFRAKWIGGSPLLHTELYYNKVARTTVLALPGLHGTPGRRNTAWVANHGPTYSELVHEPLVPKPGEPVVVRVRASDPDGLRTLTLWTSLNGAAWVSRTMVAEGGGSFTAVVPGAAADAVVQFYVAGTDSQGATTWMPSGGPSSRALYRVDTRLARAPRKAFRFILTPADGRLLDASTNMMSDDRIGATVVWNDREVFYDCGVHLHGSMFSRGNLDAVPYNVKFPADRRFRGVHRTVQLNRGVIEEIIAKHAQTQAGIPGMYEDIVELFSHRRGNAGAARLSLAHYNDIYLGSQFENGADGLLYNMEGIRVLAATHNGSVEGIKLGMPVDWVSDYDVMNLGDDPEQYRFSTTLRNNRARNDHAPYIAMAKAFSLSGTALDQAVPKVIDVDQWMRYYALLTLFEVGDTYTLGNPHNIGFYARPSDGRMLALPYDWDFFFANGDTSALWGNQNLAKVIARPVFTRLLHGNLLDLIQGTFTPEYLGPFITSFGQVAGQTYSGYLARIRARGQYVRGRLPAVVPFEITSNGGADVSVTTPEVTLEGRGWVDVWEVRQVGGRALPLTWLDGSRWRTTIPLVATTTRVDLEAFNRRGEKVGSDGVVVTTTQLDDAQRRFLRISEIHYHPADITVSESEAGWVEDDFEFLEVTNFGASPVSLEGVRIEGGVQFGFGGIEPKELAAGGRWVVVKRRDAFERRWGGGVPVAGEFEGSLNNAGEVIRLLDRQGVVIHEVAYDDDPPWPPEADGAGYSLELISPEGAIGAAAAWRIGERGGSPGRGFVDLARPRIAAMRHDGTTIRIGFEGQRGRVYQVQSATTLPSVAWEPAGAPIRPVADGAMEWEGRLDGSARFFRIVVERVAEGTALGQTIEP